MIINLYRLSGKKQLHKILNKNPHPSSAAAYLLLKRQFQKEDPSYRAARLSPRVWLTFRNKTLQKMKKENKGELTCHYCKRKPLVANFNLKGLPSKFKATLDHIFPVSKGGSKFSRENLAVCCYKCNQKKADKILKK